MSGRHDQSTIYDPPRRRILVFGGRDSHGFFFNDVWALSLADTSAWTRLLPEGIPPDARLGHTAIYDPIRDRMVVFGGWRVSDATPRSSNDVWALSLTGTPTWTQLAPSGAPPTPRNLHSAIYDPVRDRMVIFGGSGESQLGDVWALSLAGTPAWTAIVPGGTPPGPRWAHCATYDPVRHRMLVFGGLTGNDLVNDVFSLSLSGSPTWTQLSPAGAPPSPRAQQTMVYDSLHDRMIVFGGTNFAFNMDDARSLSLAGFPAWSPLSAGGVTPAARSGHGAIYDPVLDRMDVCGGTGTTIYGAGDEFNDAVSLSLGTGPTWTTLVPGSTPPVGRIVASLVYDPLRDRMVMFGGWTGVEVANDLWSFSLAGAPVWTALNPLGGPPGLSGGGQSAIYDPLRDRMLVFGGWTGLNAVNDLWEVSLSGTPTWSILTTEGTPPAPRFYHSAIYDPPRDRMVVYGGGDETGYLRDVWALSLTGVPTWTELTPAGPSPGPEYGHSALYDPLHDRMVVIFGTDSTGDRNDAWALSLDRAPDWTELSPRGTSPVARHGQSAIYDAKRGRVVVFGGNDNLQFYNDTWELFLAGTPTWTELAPEGLPPSARYYPAAIYDPVRDRMVVFGGGEPSFRNTLSDVWALDWVSVVAVDPTPWKPRGSALLAPYPNPLRTVTRVSFSLERAGQIRLAAYDVGGRLVRTLVEGERQAGTGNVNWDGTADSGRRLGAGLYFLRLTGRGIAATRKVILVD